MEILQNIISTSVLLILVIDPFGNMPVFMSILRNFDSHRRRLIIFREMLIALAILVLFLFFGGAMLKSLGLEEAALEIAGGVILFMISIRMIFSITNIQHEENGDEPMIVPLAVPFIAGPSAIATVVLMAGQSGMGKYPLLFSLLIAWAFSSLVLFGGEWISRLAGAKVLKAIERLMGMILTTIAIQMLMGGIRKFSASL